MNRLGGGETASGMETTPTSAQDGATACDS
jgi:hypothetical protein